MSIELCYAEMEAARGLAEKTYFRHHGWYDTEPNRKYFRAGFEGAYELLWNSKSAAEAAEAVRAAKTLAAHREREAVPRLEVRFDDDRRVDEVVATDAFVHLERLSMSNFCLVIYAAGKRGQFSINSVRQVRTDIVEISDALPPAPAAEVGK